MKDKITGILYNHFGWQRKVSIEKATDEILALPIYPKEFLEWVIFSNDSPYWYEKQEGKNMYWKEETNTYHTIEEVFEHWKSLPK